MFTFEVGDNSLNPCDGIKLSYFYLFDDTSDWDTGLAITWVFSAVLWLNTGLIYLGVFFYENDGTYDENKLGQFDTTRENSESNEAFG